MWCDVPCHRLGSEMNRASEVTQHEALTSIGRVGLQHAYHFRGRMSLVLPAAVRHVSADKSVFGSEALENGHGTWQSRRLCRCRCSTGFMLGESASRIE